MNSNTNSCVFPGEQKVAEGIYITKCKNENKTTTKEESKEKPKYFFKSTAELINILETEFEEIGNQIEMLYDANEQMQDFDPNDYDLIEARQENLVIINKKLARLKEIQDELKMHCPTNPLVLKDLFEYFSIKKKITQAMETENKESNQNVIANVNLNMNTNRNDEQTGESSGTQVTTEIEL